jgi:uncharacterized Zn finger protein
MASSFGEITICACGTLLSTEHLKGKAEQDRINGVLIDQKSARCPNCGTVAYREIGKDKDAKRVACSKNDPVTAAVAEPLEA